MAGMVIGIIISSAPAEDRTTVMRIDLNQMVQKIDTELQWFVCVNPTVNCK